MAHQFISDGHERAVRAFAAKHGRKWKSAEGDLLEEMLGILQDAPEIMDVLVESREELIGEECEIARCLRGRINAVLAKAGRA